jgi:predicted MPP superfamily phosphohydrolase
VCLSGYPLLLFTAAIDSEKGAQLQSANGLSRNAFFPPSVLSDTFANMPNRLHSRFSRLTWICWWQIALNVGLFLAACVMGILGTRRAFFLLTLIPLAFIPFSYARVWLQMFLDRLLGAGVATRRLLVVLTGLGVACDVVMMAQLLTARAGTPTLVLHGPVVSWIGPIWFSAHALFFLGSALVRLGQWVVRLLGQVVPPRTLGDPEPVASPERRQFLQSMGVLGAGVPFFISLSNVKLSYDFRVEERDIVLPNWPKELDGLRIAHLSDIHVGGAMNRERLLRMAALTNEAQPDLVMHTGDFLVHRTGNFDAPLYEALARIRAPHGQWACLGNHDFDAPERLAQRLDQAGVTVLRDTMVTLSIRGVPLEVGGLDYLRGQGEWEERYARLLHAWPPRTVVPRILLNHIPQTFSSLPSGCADLVLSGHTHGGHVGVQLGQDMAFTVVGLLGIPDQGIFYRSDMTMYVTRCVGFYGYPMRLGIPPEIALLTIRTQTGSRT